MIQMFTKLSIAMASCCDVKVSLYLVSIEAAKDSATIRRASHPGRLGKLPLSRLAQLLMDVPQLLPTRRTVLFCLAQFMGAPLQVLARPLAPVGGIFAQQVTGKRAVTGSVLHVNVEIGAPHGDDDVEVDLHVMRDTLLDGEGLRGRAGEPARNLGPGQVETCQDEGDCPGGGVAALHQVRLLCLG